MRVISLLVLVLVLGALVASGMQHGWTPMHLKFGVPLAVIAVIVAMPTKRPAEQKAGGRYAR